MDLWRLTLHPTLDGEGGRLYPGRWNSGGAPMVYLAESPAGALIEILVNLELDESELPPVYKLLRVSFESTLRSVRLRVPPGQAWKSELSLTRKVGDAWLKSRRSALARVPSAILPDTFNYLLNPLHPDADRINIADVHRATLDPRLIRMPRKWPRYADAPAYTAANIGPTRSIICSTTASDGHLAGVRTHSFAAP